MHLTALLTAVLFALGERCAAHPGAGAHREFHERREFLLAHRSTLTHCNENIHASGLHKRALVRRAGLAGQVMARQNSGPHYSDKGFTPETDLATVFAGNNSCVLTPSSTEGPFYVTGEDIKQDIVEGQPGIPFALDLQVVNVQTCEPIKDAYIELWNANATGVYSGIVSNMNGAGARDQGNLEKTFLRGIQKTDENGAVQFHTIFPGHYSGRTVHIHVMVHTDAVVHENGTIIDTNPAHVGQLYFDPDLYGSIRTTSPYSSNTQQLMQNSADYVLRLEPAGSDPFVHYNFVGSSAVDGVVGWFTMGIDPAAAKQVQAASNRMEGGSKSNPINFGLFPGPGGPPGGGHDFPDDDKRAYLKAQQCVLTSPAKGTIQPGAKTRWDEFASLHQIHAFQIHTTGQFLPYHRYMLKIHRELLKECGYEGVIPYWDETRDAGANFAKSPVFDAELGFGGSGSGAGACVQNGPFVNMTVSIGPGFKTDPRCVNRVVTPALSSQVGKDFVDKALLPETYEEMLPLVYGGPHLWGHIALSMMNGDSITSAGDPLFMMHHGFVDKMWWDWQEKDPAKRLKDIGGINVQDPAVGFSEFSGGMEVESAMWGKPTAEMIAVTPDPQNGDDGPILTLNHIMSSNGIIPDMTVAEIMDTRSEDLCYVYI
ncbi:uncharacterized protein DNG_07921 [Cephalotrichum gorgonifer]|uniref:Tyrosinase copper-binding domain-containing protein n=1 Tax=Cephalotrichum gorgonifer TaxID=2041049 RepID=A0AAE8SXX8_9PEZI|nr:uncharacterized protein DNG_07921 [Cephalotrichum gorgonifer]